MATVQVEYFIQNGQYPTVKNSKQFKDCVFVPDLGGITILKNGFIEAYFAVTLCPLAYYL
jgi:hypothetical protein